MKYEITKEIDKARKDAIKEAINYLLIKNEDIVYLEGDILYDRKEKKYYDCKTGELLNKIKKIF
ncbi:MAG: hypothetical protein NC918_02625 [Candidatus Omnitrophica bacterium]|nr:hypothetical protein [Candidatus Omnitrophota bacterium]